jgi:CelD/BcsL family acetyltransferase involved in cellulose biosynthesis
MTEVRDLGPADRDGWLAVARRCAYATYFHTPEWAELQATFHPSLMVAAQAYRLADGTVVILPMLQHRGGATYDSMVPGVYGGPIAERVLSSAEVDAILSAAVAAGASRIRVFGNPYLEHFRAEASAADEFTHRIDLRDGFDVTFRRFHQNHRRAYRYAVRRNVTLTRATTLDDVREYHRIYRIDRRRWARPKTDDPVELFEEIHRRCGEHTILWLAKVDGQVIAGDLWFYWNQHNVGWHGAADPAFFKYFPTNFLITEIARDAAARGHQWLDLNPSGGDDGVVRFKDSFGAERLHFRHAERRSEASPPHSTLRERLSRIRTRVAGLLRRRGGVRAWGA